MVTSGHVTKMAVTPFDLTSAKTLCCTQTSPLYVLQKRSYCRWKFYTAGMAIFDGTSALSGSATDKQKTEVYVKTAVKKVCPFTVLSTTYNYISHTRTHIHQNTSGLSRSSVANNDVVTLLHNSLTVRQLYYMNARLLLHSYSEVNLSHSTDDTTRWTIKTLRSVFESSLLFWHFRIVFIVNKCHTHSY